MAVNSEHRNRSEMNVTKIQRHVTKSFGDGACEWDRLVKEREELLASGCYVVADPLIQEIDRQITASKLKAGAQD